MVFENLMALYIAIQEECPPEIAFKRLDHYCGQAVKNFRFPWNYDDVSDIEIFKNKGISWREIGTYYGVGESTVWSAYYNYKKRKKPTNENVKGGDLDVKKAQCR